LKNNSEVKNKIKHEALDWLGAIIYAVIFGTIIRLFVLETMMVPTPSMVPTIKEQDRFLVEKITYSFERPNTGDIVVFWTPFVDVRAQAKLRAFDNFMDFFAPKEFEGHAKYVKRLVGKPGDNLRLVPVEDSFWEKLDLNEENIKNYPDFLQFIIKYYERIEYIPSSVKSRVAQLEINGKIPESLKNRYYLIDGVFYEPNFYDFLAYPEKNERKINLSKYTMFYKDNFDGNYALYNLRPNLEFYKQSNYAYDYDETYKKFEKDFDLKEIIYRDEEGLINIKIPEGYYYFMGDNSLESWDSRFFGFVPENNIIGNIFLRIGPLDRFGKVK
jgi:signal peptidase I